MDIVTAQLFKIKNFFKKKRKIRFAIIAVFMALFSFSTIVTTTYTYVNIQEVMDLTSRDIINKTQKIIVDDVVDYLNSALQMVQVGGWIERKDTTSILEDHHFLQFMISVLKNLDQVDLIYTSDAKGNFISAGRLGGRKVFMYHNDRPLPHASEFYINRIRRDGDEVVETREYLSKDEVPLVSETNPIKANIFEPRSRPWYKQTMEKRRANWSSIYGDWDTEEFSITVSKPLFAQDGSLLKIISADIRLDQISKLLRQQKASRSGINFIINEKGQLVGYPDPHRIIKEKNGEKSLATLEEMGEETLAKVYRYYKKTKKTQFFLTHQNIQYIVYFTKFPKNFDKEWTLGMVAPADDFIGALKETNRDVMMISLLILAFSSIFLVVFSHKISYPIEILAQQMKRIKDLDIDEEEQSHDSRLEEISQMDQALQMMKEGLASFGKFVPKALVQRLIETGKEAKLGGERKNLVILFSDIASFTTISEKMDSDTLMTHLSDYLSDLSQVVLNYKGTIDKYIGDAIMAFWGAPQEDENLLVNACTATLVCANHLKKQNKIWEAEGKPPLPTRFGLHYGEVIVGNVGSADRMNYTVIGDSVNLASRLEGINKIYETTIIASETIYKEMKDKFLFRPLDIVAVKGKKQGVHIYELMGKLNEDPELHPTKEDFKISELTEEAFASYKNQDWKNALRLYKKLRKEKAEDYIAQLYIERCNKFIKEPPRDWDGVYRLKTK